MRLTGRARPAVGHLRLDRAGQSPDLGGTMAREDQRRTESGIPVETVYRADDLAGFDPASVLGEPGEPPFTRGIHPTMYRGRVWTMRQYAGFGSAAETNARFRYLLDQGQTGLSVALDDHQRPRGAPAAALPARR